MLEKEFQYFKENQDTLVNKYKGKVLVIVGQEVVGQYDTEINAYFDSLKKFKPGEFLIQECLSGKEVYTQHFHNLSIF